MASALRLTRLKVRNWRNFRQAEVKLAARAFFVGPNASGKSNLLDAVRFLRDLVKPSGGGLAAAVEERGGIASLRCLEARGRRTEIEIEVDVGDDANSAVWSYHLSFTRVGKENFPSVRRETIWSNGNVIKENTRDENEDGLIFSQTLIEQVAQNIDFRALAAFFASIRYLHVVPQIVRDPKRAIDKRDDPFGGDLLQRISDTSKKQRDARLKKIGEALSKAVPQFQSLRLEKDSQGLPHLVAGFKHWRERPSDQNESLFSDGTLRLIGFLWSIGEKGGPLLLEEPELSLHEEVVRQLPAMIHRMQRDAKRQVLMTTHSQAMLDDSGIGLDEVHRLEPGTNGTSIVTASDDEMIRKQIEVGFQIGETIIPMTKSYDVERLPLFDVFS